MPPRTAPPIGYKGIILEFQHGYLLAWCQCEPGLLPSLLVTVLLWGRGESIPRPPEVALVRGWKSFPMHHRLSVPRARAELLCSSVVLPDQETASQSPRPQIWELFLNRPSLSFHLPPYLSILSYRTLNLLPPPSPLPLSQVLIISFQDHL